MKKFYEIILSESEYEEYNNAVLQDKGDYVAGLLLGRFKLLWLVDKEKGLKEEDLI